MGAMNFALMYNDPTSASATDNITAVMTYAVLWIAPLLERKVVLIDMKKHPPVVFLACDLFK